MMNLDMRRIFFIDKKNKINRVLGVLQSIYKDMLTSMSTLLYNK